MTTGPQSPDEEVTQRIQHLRAMFADLDGYIQRRAEDLAEPMIRDAEARARLATMEVRSELQRERDLVHELRRRLAADDRFREEMRRYQGLLAAVLGRPASAPWPSIVAEIVTRLEGSQNG